MIQRSVETYPPAKLNLFLEVLGKRADGYHELEMVMIAISLRDRLRITSIPEPEIRLDCRWCPSLELRRRQVGFDDRAALALPPTHENLVYRAIAEFRAAYGVSTGFEIVLEKQIPAGAGMGGASSDAASALMAAAQLSGFDPGDHKLCKIGEILGSDIPFFWGGELADKTASGEKSLKYLDSDPGVLGAAVVRGRGERVRRIPASSGLHFVVVYPPQALSTALVFASCRPAQGLKDSQACQLALRSGSVTHLASSLYNRLTESARELSPLIEKTIVEIELAGVKPATMTGSGSACFGIAGSAVVARAAKNRLASRGLGLCFTAAPVRLPTPIRFVT